MGEMSKKLEINEIEHLFELGLAWHSIAVKANWKLQNQLGIRRSRNEAGVVGTPSAR